jgi:hypothetical protein
MRTPAVSACSMPPGRVANALDCDDAAAGVSPSQVELPYDGVDNDCDGKDLTDVDGDGHDATVAGGEDCDDADASVSPGATETWANGVTDNDCDGVRESVRLDYGAEAWIGASPGGQAGRRASALGDVTGDGLADYLVGAVYEGSEFEKGGAVYLVEGGAPGGSLARANVLLPGGEYWFLPQIVEGGPDVDGDGVVDFVATVTTLERSAGAGFLVSGARFGASAALTLPSDSFAAVLGDAESDYAGAGAAFVGDVMGDGLEYLAVGALWAAPLATGRPGRGMARRHRHPYAGSACSISSFWNCTNA